MKSWVELTGKNNDPIWVNLAIVGTMHTNSGTTIVKFHDGETPFTVTVTETPEEILIKAGILRGSVSSYD
jgi:hypothetical protein